MAGEDEDWRRLLEQYLPPLDPRRDVAAEPEADPDDAPWRLALRDAARRAPSLNKRDGQAGKRRPPAKVPPTPRPPPTLPAEVGAADTNAVPTAAESPVKVGQRVAIRSLRGLRGQVRELRGAQALVETEAGRVWVGASELILVSGEHGHDRPSAAGLPRRSAADAASHGAPLVRQGGKRSPKRRSIDLHGMLLSEALDRLDEFLYASWDAAYPAVAIVHGKGAGTLRGAVRELLAAHPAVHHCTAALPREGGEGVTIASLYRR